MATYIMLANFTDQGIRNIKDTVKRAEAFKELAKGAGVTVKELCWTLGQYDIVARRYGGNGAGPHARKIRQLAHADAARLFRRRHE
jgi:uncharacterized protein with GYD domain